MLFKPDLNEKAKAAGESVARIASSARRRTVSITIALLIIGGVTYLIWSLFQQTQSASRGRPDLAVPVLAATPRVEDVPVYLDGVGSVRALNNVTVRAQVDGSIDASLQLAGSRQPLVNGEDVTLQSLSPLGAVDLQDVPLVFVGYGIDAPEWRWNDYAGLDVKGKTVVVLVNDPGYATGDPKLFKGRTMTYYGTHQRRRRIARIALLGGGARLHGLFEALSVGH